ncbi:hypothetical protein [Ruegeria arenilitoris]|uniref:hypothetical protein n=1 Tax=Ruegeria arenilitoris TaxID=1173585 RepID=UPI00147DDC4D|nr:hypothetical protein [Ruegeria arenilitoris]
MYFSTFDGHRSSVNDIQKDEFARKFPLLEDADVYARWKASSWQITRIGDIWKRSGRIFSLNYAGSNVYPSFQFAEDGTPLPLMKKILDALPQDMTPWERAFWMASPKNELEGECPVKCVRRNDDRVIQAASKVEQLTTQ